MQLVSHTNFVSKNDNANWFFSLSKNDHVALVGSILVHDMIAMTNLFLKQYHLFPHSCNSVNILTPHFIFLA
jgi:hypothetical protein